MLLPPLLFLILSLRLPISALLDSEGGLHARDHTFIYADDPVKNNHPIWWSLEDRGKMKND
jgi:hypothetical protein